MSNIVTTTTITTSNCSPTSATHSTVSENPTPFTAFIPLENITSSHHNSPFKKTGSLPLYDNVYNKHATKQFSFNNILARVDKYGSISLYIISIALLSLGAFQSFSPLLRLSNLESPAAMDFYPMRTCVTTPNGVRSCGPISLQVNSVPQLQKLRPYLPGFSLLYLPILNKQFPLIIFVPLLVQVISLLVYLPVWTLYYYPKTKIFGKRGANFLRNHPSTILHIAGWITFGVMLVIFTGGLAYRFYLWSYWFLFLRSINSQSAIDPFLTNWKIQMMPSSCSFIVWHIVSIMCMAISVWITGNVRNGMAADVGSYQVEHLYGARPAWAK